MFYHSPRILFKKIISLSITVILAFEHTVWAKNFDNNGSNLKAVQQLPLYESHFAKQVDGSDRFVSEAKHKFNVLSNDASRSDSNNYLREEAEKVIPTDYKIFSSTNKTAPNTATSVETDGSQTNDYNSPLVNCMGTPTTNFKYTQTESAWKSFHKEETLFLEHCSESELDGKVSAAGGMVNAGGDESGVGITSTTEAKSAAGLASAGIFHSSCEAFKSKVEALAEKVEQTYTKENKSCLSQGTTFGNLKPVGMTPKQTCEDKVSQNAESCKKVVTNVYSWKNKALAFLENHWQAILLTLGALGVGLYALNSSSGKQKNDFKTTPDGGLGLGSTKTGDTGGDLAKPDPTITTPGETPTAAVPVTTAPGEAEYCKASLRPLECFVTPGCDLKCVSDKYGVSSYGGMDRDTTRIDKSGRPVDATAAATVPAGTGGASGSSGGSSGGGSGAGGSVAELGGSGSTTSSGEIATRGSLGSGYNDGDSGFGGGSGTYGSDSERDPASSDRYKGGGLGSHSVAANKDPAASGPILPPTVNLFERIWTVTRTQCVRDLVICNGK